MRTVLITHHDAPLDNEGLSRWLASFTDLAGIVVIEEGGGQMKRRIKHEWRRSGTAGLIDVLAFRIYYKLFLARRDAEWTAAQQRRLTAAYPAATAPVLNTHSPNTAEVAAFLRGAQADVVIARCKHLLRRDIYDIPRSGTFVLHPGICPEYRNAHGCFWALYKRDLSRVGVTLLKVDDGVDTGAAYGYYSCKFDELSETHYQIQWRCVLDNLDAIAGKFIEIDAGRAVSIDTAGRPSAVWGQPWLSKYVTWKYRAWRDR